MHWASQPWLKHPVAAGDLILAHSIHHAHSVSVALVNWSLMARSLL